MIKFKRNKKEVQVFVSDEITNTDWIFSHEVSHKSNAEICKKHFNKKLKERIRKIRKDAYEKGYKEGRHHSKKDKTFSPCIKNDTVGWKF